jgi:hypothetical protein
LPSDPRISPFMNDTPWIEDCKRAGAQLHFELGPNSRVEA